jgi:CheY-like chemotaxis protein
VAADAPASYGAFVSRVLVVDDDDDVRAATQDAMERRGFEVVAVSSGAEALAYINCDVPSIILLDLHMDDMNGWEVLGAIRSDPRFENVEVVVVTGSEASVAAPVKVLRKPFKIEALLALLETPAPRTLAS